MSQLRGKDAINKLTGVTPVMFSEEIRSQMSLPKRVVMNDISLREGRQVEGTLMTADECVKIAELLVNELNVPMIQMGGYKPRDREAMKAVRKFLDGCGKKIRTESMTSAHQNYPKFNGEQLFETISVIADSGFGAVVCLATSDDLLRGCAKFRNEAELPIETLRQQELEMAVAAIEHGRKKGITEFNINCQDFLRADFGFLSQFVKACADAGANTIFMDDFGGGLAAPILYTHLFKKLKKVVPNTALGVHAHNTAGMSTATALASVEGGCEVITAGVNGYGEGPGHVNLAETVYHLEFIYGFDTGIRLDKLRSVSVLMADIMRQDLPKTTPLVGDAAFVFMHDKHHQFPEYPFIFCPVKAEVVGNRARPGFAEWAGPFGLKLHLKELGVEIPEERITPMLAALEDNLRWRKRPLTDSEFKELASTVCAA
jgi:isopropylmalate/homocitrate/citramalate synthase